MCLKEGMELLNLIHNLYFEPEIAFASENTELHEHQSSKRKTKPLPVSSRKFLAPVGNVLRGKLSDLHY